MASEVVSPGAWVDDDAEHFELLDGRMVRKASVGRKGHSDLEIVVLEKLRRFARELGGLVAQEWTVLNGPDKVIPDITFSFPDPKLFDGYLVAPAFLVVEAASKDQSLSSLLRKCRDRYHPFGTPYCWILDPEEEAGYECHRVDKGLFRLVDFLTAGPSVSLSVAEIFLELKQRS